MMPLNEQSVLVMDNCSVQHIEPVLSLLQEVIFTSPYNPDLNPVEEVFNELFEETRPYLQHIPDPSERHLVVSLSSTVEH